eukprot:m.292615 g.292615  ORF g.292615 m.292615 type:complete len:93 (+) comp20005_c0_seq1:339-617(+)
MVFAVLEHQHGLGTPRQPAQQVYRAKHPGGRLEDSHGDGSFWRDSTARKNDALPWLGGGYHNGTAKQSQHKLMSSTVDCCLEATNSFIAIDF